VRPTPKSRSLLASESAWKAPIPACKPSGGFAYARESTIERKGVVSAVPIGSDLPPKKTTPILATSDITCWGCRDPIDAAVLGQRTACRNTRVPPCRRSIWPGARQADAASLSLLRRAFAGCLHRGSVRRRHRATRVAVTSCRPSSPLSRWPRFPRPVSWSMSPEKPVWCSCRWSAVGSARPLVWQQTRPVRTDRCGESQNAFHRIVLSAWGWWVRPADDGYKLAIWDKLPGAAAGEFWHAAEPHEDVVMPAGCQRQVREAILVTSTQNHAPTSHCEFRPQGNRPVDGNVMAPSISHLLMPRWQGQAAITCPTMWLPTPFPCLRTKQSPSTETGIAS